MEAVTLLLPSKTFLAGEYMALLGELSWVINTSPYFKFKALKPVPPGRTIPEGMTVTSPAGQWWQKNQSLFKDWHIVFVDPHNERGGLGASSAQFAALYWFREVLRRHDRNFTFTAETLDWQDLLSEYHSVAWNGEGLAPSGVDVIAQLLGQDIVGIERHSQKIMIHSWPFIDYEFAVVRTYQKVATHEHLKKIHLKKDESMVRACQMVGEALTIPSWPLFCQSICQFNDGLNNHSFVCQETLKLLDKMKKQDFEIIAKGCGALGADLILCFFAKKDLEKISFFFNDQRLEVVATSNDLTSSKTRLAE